MFLFRFLNYFNSPNPYLWCWCERASIAINSDDFTVNSKSSSAARFSRITYQHLRCDECASLWVIHKRCIMRRTWSFEIWKCFFVCVFFFKSQCIHFCWMWLVLCVCSFLMVWILRYAVFGSKLSGWWWGNALKSMRLLPISTRAMVANRETASQKSLPSTWQSITQMGRTVSIWMSTRRRFASPRAELHNMRRVRVVLTVWAILQLHQGAGSAGRSSTLFI